MRRFYAAPGEFSGTGLTLSPSETRHLRNVLRLRAGDDVRVFDGTGREFHCEIVDVKKGGAELRVVTEVEPAAPESSVEVTLAAAAYLHDKLDLVVQKAVELGVVRFRPLVTARSEVKYRDMIKRAERWRKIALEATKQCERARIMLVDEPVLFESFAAESDPSAGLLLMFSEKGGGKIPEDVRPARVTALVGPKGGWEDSEIEVATQRGYVPIKLGRRIMRAETAAITFAALVQHRFGDLN